MARKKNNKLQEQEELSYLTPPEYKNSAYASISLPSSSSEDFGTALASCGGGGSPAMGTRQNVATSIPPIAQFSNIWEGGVNVYPYGNAGSFGGNGAGGGVYGLGPQIYIGYAIQLLQSAYTFIPKLTQTINLGVELCVGNILLKGGTAQSRKFYETWLEKIGIDNVQNQYYLEDDRSGNVFYYRINATVDKATVKQFNEAFGAAGDSSSAKSLPIRYLLMNPAWVGVMATTNFLNPVYYKTLTPFELGALIGNPSEADLNLIAKSPELKKFVDAYKGTKKNISTATPVYLPLDGNNLIAIFRHKQDYEAMSAPPFFGLMALFNQKIEYMKIDMAINRQILQATLLITMGDEKLGAPSPKQIQTMTNLFNNNSISKVLIGDYTIEGKWLVPNTAELFDPKKYQEIDKDIEEGLGNVLYGDSKYSGASVKADIFVERLNYRRNRFITKFLIPEMKKIAETFGFKDIPMPIYQPISIKEQATRERVFAQMAQLGLLTPDELNTALETNILPTDYESILNQEKYKAQRDRGLYAPLLGKPEDDGGDGGRPAGSSSPQTSKKIKKVGNVGASTKYTVAALKDTLLKATQLEKEAEKLAKNKFNVKSLNKQQKELIGSLVEDVIKNEAKDTWTDKLNDYIEFKEAEKSEISYDILATAINFEVDHYEGAILYHSQEEIKE